MRVSDRQQTRNRAVRSQVRLAIRKYREADLKEKAALLPVTASALDNAVRKGIIKRTTASRMKSRLTKHLNRLQQESAS
jgi:ribosomal protein S20